MCDFNPSLQGSKRACPDTRHSLQCQRHRRSHDRYMLTPHLTGLSSNGYNCVEREHKDRELHHRCFNNHNQVAVHTHLWRLPGGKGRIELGL